MLNQLILYVGAKVSKVHGLQKQHARDSLHGAVTHGAT